MPVYDCRTGRMTPAGCDILDGAGWVIPTRWLTYVDTDTGLIERVDVDNPRSAHASIRTDAAGQPILVREVRPLPLTFLARLPAASVPGDAHTVPVVVTR